MEFSEIFCKQHAPECTLFLLPGFKFFDMGFWKIFFWGKVSPKKSIELT